MQLLSLIPILILLLYLLVSIDLVYNGLCGLDILNLFQRRPAVFRLSSYIQIVLVLKLQVVSALQIIVSVSYGL